MAKYIMVQGTTSNAGKTTVCAGLCRILAQDGYKVAPFKAQNMGLNSYFDDEGGEMGFGQALQAYAAYIEPKAIMNPLLLKPKGKNKIDIILNGQLDAVLSGPEFYNKKQHYFNEALKSLAYLEENYDVIVIEGAGSPAEINMKKPDIANMGLATKINAPVILVGNIELGGVFASVYGTYALLEDDEQALVKGFIINKLHGFADLLDSGITKLEELMKVKSLGVIPHISLDLEDEDMPTIQKNISKEHLNIGVIKSSYATNLNIFKYLEGYTNISLTILDRPFDAKDYEILVIPSTNNVSSDIKWFIGKVDFNDKLIYTYENGSEVLEGLKLANKTVNLTKEDLTSNINEVINLMAVEFNYDIQLFNKDSKLEDIREEELDKLADHLRESLNMAEVYKLIED